MSAYQQPSASPAIVCTVCASADWCACSPGTEAEEREQGNLFVLDPAPEVPAKFYCRQCLPWRAAPMESPRMKLYPQITATMPDGTVGTWIGGIHESIRESENTIRTALAEARAASGVDLRISFLEPTTGRCRYRVRVKT
jgi:hypothetical protein